MHAHAGMVLVVDDDAENRDTLAEVLTPGGFEVITAPDGLAALAQFERCRPDVVLLDITMPGLDGFDVLDVIRARWSRNQLPVIMLTGCGQRDRVVRALDAGANDYVTKPFDVQVVEARLRSQVALKRAYDQIVVLEQDLALRNTQLARSNRLLRQANKVMRDELVSAAEVQRALLPSGLPELPGVRFSWAFQPCTDLAGDILNVFELDDRHVGFYLLDVSGHGVRAALLSVALSRILTPLPRQTSVVRRWLPHERRYQPVAPAEVAAELNHRFQLTEETYQYFTLCYGVLDVHNYELRYVCGGHPGPIHVPAHGPPRTLGPRSMAIGLAPEARYHDAVVQLQAGDRVYLNSDGVNEARNDRKELFGEQRIVRALTSQRRRDLDQCVRHMLDQARAFAGREFEDDVSALAFEIKPSVEQRHALPLGLLQRTAAELPQAGRV